MAKDEQATRTASDERSDRKPSTAGLPKRARNRYQFEAEHGRGGIGRVTRARDKELAREVAIKELIDPAPTHEARFVREAMITARLQHPGIVPVYEAGRAASRSTR